MVASMTASDQACGELRHRTSGPGPTKAQQEQKDAQIASTVPQPATPEERHALERALEAARSQRRAVVLYDGLCNVCNASIRFTLPRIGSFEEERVLYASLQSKLAKQVIEKTAGAEELNKAFYEGTDVPATSYVISNGKVTSQSQGSVTLLRLMDGQFWNTLGVVVDWIPQGFRDKCYEMFAAQRFNLFGGTEQVQAFPPEASRLFVDAHEGIHLCPIPNR